MYIYEGGETQNIYIRHGLPACAPRRPPQFLYCPHTKLGAMPTFHRLECHTACGALGRIFEHGVNLLTSMRRVGLVGVSR